jgi:hypothetical protein
MIFLLLYNFFKSMINRKKLEPQFVISASRLRLRNTALVRTVLDKKSAVFVAQVCGEAIPEGAVSHRGAAGQLTHDARQEHRQEAHDRQVPP